MVFIKLRAQHTPTKDFLLGLKKATKMPHHKIRRAFTGTKISRNPDLSLTKQEVSKALARFQRKTKKNITKEEQKELEDFLNKRYQVQKKEQIQKNIQRMRQAEKEARGKELKKALEKKGKTNEKGSDNSSQTRLDIQEHPLPKALTHNRGRPSSATGKIQLPSTYTPTQQPKTSPPLTPPTPKKTPQEPEDLPID